MAHRAGRQQAAALMHTMCVRHATRIPYQSLTAPRGPTTSLPAMHHSTHTCQHPIPHPTAPQP